MKIYLFYNGDTGEIPGDSNAWTEYKDPDSFKLAWTCADSWKRQGWLVERLRIFRSVPFVGRLRNSGYPYNNFLPTLKLMAKDEDPIWFTTSDVINFGFSAEQAAEMPLLNRHVCPNHAFTLACGRVSAYAIEQMLCLLNKYDLGELPPLAGLQADEHVLRNVTPYPDFCSYYNLMGPPTSAVPVPLVHYSRSCLQWFPSQLF